MTSEILNPSDKVQSDKDIYELIKKINPTNYQDSSKVYLIKDVINNITSVLPIFLSRSLIMQQATLDEKSDWNNLQPNSMQVFLSTSGLNAPYLASTNNTGIVFTFNLKTDEIDKMYQLAFSVGDNISFAIRGKDTDLDGAKWHYTPNVVDYDTFKGAVNDKLDDMYSKFVTGMDAYKPENLEPVIEKADKMVQDATNNAQISVDGFKADITKKVNDTLAQLKTVQDSANKLQSQVTDFSNQKMQEINNNYDSQLKDLEKTYVADVQSYITQVNKAQATLDDINKTVSSLDVSKLIDLSDYYTKEDVNKVIANTLSGYITSTAVDTKISNAISPLQTQVNNSAVGTNLYTDTKNFDNPASWYSSSSWTKTTDTYNGLAVMQTTQNWHGLSQYTQVKKGDILTYSVYAKYISGTGTSVIYWQLNNQTEGSYSTATANPISNTVTITDSWQRVSGTTVATSDGYLCPRLERGASNTNTLQIAGIKVEKGSVATDWCPNPEDKVNVADMRKPASDVAGIEEVNAKADTSAVDQLKTDLTDQVSTLQTQVNNSAVGTNLLTGTGSHTVTGTESQTPGFLSNDDLLTLFKGLEGQTVTVSVDYEYSGFIAGSGTFNRLGWEVIITADHMSTFNLWYEPNNDSGSGRMSTTFVVPKNIKVINEGRGYIEFPGSGTGTLSHFKLEKGSVATDWCPNPSEILTKGEAGTEGSSDKYTGVKEVTQAEYDALTTKDPNTIYYIWLS